MKKHIPNFITSLNAFSGCIACVMAFQGEFGWVVFWVLMAGMFDFMDGFSARLLQAYSPMGKDLDSLADLISFGMAPSVAIFHLLSASNVVYPESLSPLQTYIPYLGFVIAIFSLVRLAKFNIDTRQSDSFIGLATPANALFWISLCAGIYEYPTIRSGLLLLVVLLIFIFSYLMISEIPMFALKKRKLQLRGNEQLIALIVFIIVSISFLHILGIAASVLFYICLCVFNRKKHLTANS